MGGGRNRNKSRKASNRAAPSRQQKMRDAAAKRHANFKKTGVQTHGGTRKNYSKREAEKIGKLGAVGNESSSQAFSRITGGAANPLNRAPSTEGVKVGEMKPEFASGLTGTDYSKFAAPNINYNYSERSPSDMSFSDAVRGGARFNESAPGRNDLTTDKKVASSFSAGSGLFGNDIDVGDGVFRTKDQIIKMRDNPQNFNLSPGSRLFKQIQEAGKGLVSAPNTSENLIAAADPTQLTGLGSTPSSPYTSTTGLDSVIRQGLGMDTTSGGLNIGSSDVGLDSETSSRIGRALAAGPSPRMLSEGGDLQMSDMFNADTPGATLTQGINAVKNRIPILNRLPDMKINSVAEEAQRRYLGYNPNLPASALARMDKRGGSGSGFVAAPTVFNQALPQQQVVPTASTTGTTQTGVDPNRLLQIQQQAYQQAYNPMTIGGFSPQFRFGGSAPSIDYSTYFNYS